MGLWAGWEYIGLRNIYQSNTAVTAIVWYSGLVDNQNSSVWKNLKLLISGPLGWPGIHRFEKHLSEQYCSYCYSMVQWVSGQSKQLCVGKIYNFGFLGLWADWEYIGLRNNYQTNTVVIAIVWRSGLVDQPILLSVKFCLNGLLVGTEYIGMR